MLNKIWAFFIMIGITSCIFTGNIKVINETILTSGKEALDMIINIFPVIAIWLGLMNIAVHSKLLDKLSNLLRPLLKKLFPDIPRNHDSLKYISTNIIANMFGLGSVATPSGLKAMSSLQELNKNKDTASSSMITFLVLNTSGVTIIPTTMISLRIMHKSVDPTRIILPCIFATILSSIAGLLMDKHLRRKYK